MHTAGSLSLLEAINLFPERDPTRDRSSDHVRPRERVTTRLGVLRETTFRDLFVDHLSGAWTVLWWSQLLKLALARTSRFFFGVSEKAIYDGIFAGPFTLHVAAAWSFTNGARTKLIDGTFDIDSDSWKMALFLSTSNIGAASTTYAGLTNEHANANGYATGGIAITLTLAGTTTVTVDIQTDPVWTASGGSITARFAVIYEVGGNVLCYTTLDTTPADVTTTDGNTLTIAAHTSGVFTLS